MKKIIKAITIIIFLVISSMTGPYNHAYADENEYGFGVSPMNQKIILNPGEKYTGSFKINNPDGNNNDFRYEVKVKPFYVDENYKVYYDEPDTFNEIVNWTTLETTEGQLEVNEVETIRFNIDVPENAPSGGQYMAIMVQSQSDTVEDDSEQFGIKLQQNIAIAHVVYAEITGTNTHQGEVVNIDVPAFLFDGNIKGFSSIKNTGNVHGTASYTLQVYPLFSEEEVYTNEEKPVNAVILPERTRYVETVWDKTPSIGIFNVVYTVEFEGVTTQVSKMVIKCPIWLLFIIIFAIAAIIIYFIAKARKRNIKKETA